MLRAHGVFSPVPVTRDISLQFCPRLLQYSPLPAGGLCVVFVWPSVRSDNISAFLEQTRGFTQMSGAPAFTCPLVRKMSQSDLRLQLTARRSRCKKACNKGWRGGSVEDGGWGVGLQVNTGAAPEKVNPRGCKQD